MRHEAISYTDAEGESSRADLPEISDQFFGISVDYMDIQFNAMIGAGSFGEVHDAIYRVSNVEWREATQLKKKRRAFVWL